MIPHSDLKFLLWSVFAANSPGKVSKLKLHLHKLASNPGRSLGTWLLNFFNNLAKSESDEWSRKRVFCNCNHAPVLVVKLSRKHL